MNAILKILAETWLLAILLYVFARGFRTECKPTKTAAPNYFANDDDFNT